ncbi:hypothetical protein C4D60_Mb07t06070 [Musa balbisiana]|uniref:WAT1-related protein n=1 Tax=Musa balbisiana TaxID=52838 RepID=A0A4S8JDG8_MUSBA|nr:hypothetical protein C4D60_Mb07t06070 [Musa balbisiana]
MWDQKAAVSIIRQSFVNVFNTLRTTPLHIFRLVMGDRGEFMRRAMPYLTMITLQFSDAGKNILSKASLGSGMSQYVLVVYSHAFATLSIAPLAFILERPVMDQIFYHAGLKHTSVIFSSAMSSISPAMTIVVAVLSGMEKVDLKKVIYQAKVVGTLVTVAGAMLMALYKGPPVELVWGKHADSLGSNSPAVTESSSNNWYMGSGFHILATLASASLSLLQKSGAVFGSAFSPLRMIIVAIMGASFLNEKIYLGGVLGAILIVIGLYSVLWGNSKQE